MYGFYSAAKVRTDMGACNVNIALYEALWELIEAFCSGFGQKAGEIHFVARQLCGKLGDAMAAQQAAAKLRRAWGIAAARRGRQRRALPSLIHDGISLKLSCGRVLGSRRATSRQSFDSDTRPFGYCPTHSPFLPQFQSEKETRIHPPIACPAAHRPVQLR